MTRRSAPKKLTVTPDWCERVEAALFARQMSKAALAREVGCSRAVITLLLSGKQDASIYVKPISETLRIPLPTATGAETEFLKRVKEAAQELSEDDLQLVEDLLETLIRRKSNDSEE